MTVEIVLDPGGANELTIDDDEIQNYQPVKTHTGIGDFRATVAPNRALEPYAQRQNRVDIRINGTTQFTGYLIDVTHNKASGTATIAGDGVGKRLQETRPDYDSIGGPLTYSNISLVEALRDYWPRTPFTNFSVTDQTTTQVADDQQLQEANTNTEWSNITTIGANDPVKVQNNNLELLQSADTRDCLDDNDNSSGVGLVNGDEYNDGQAYQTGASGSFVEFDITFDYTIPNSRVGIKIRDELVSADAQAEFQWDGTVFDSINLTGDIALAWTEIGTAGAYGAEGGYQTAINADIEAGTTYTFRIETTGASSDYTIDAICVYDTAFNYTFSNPGTENNAGILDGPEEYPDAYTEPLDSSSVSFNITSATVTSTWNDTTGTQAIILSNDGGTTTQTFSNTSTATANFTSAGREAQTQFTFSRYGTGGTSIPATGYLGQTVTDYVLTIDGDDLIVIDDLELNRNHFDNLKTLHEYGAFNWVIEHDSGSLSSLVVSSFLEGDEVRTQPAGFDDPINVNPEVQSGVYFNSIFLQGALVGGSRVTSEIKDNDAIANDDREISPGVLRDYNVTTQAGADFRARSLLNAALSNNDLIGSITVPPTMTDPGYAVPVDLGDGLENKTIEEVSLTEGTNGSEATFDFTVRTGFERDISDLRQNARDIGNNV